MSETTTVPTRLASHGRAEAYGGYMNDHVTAKIFKEHMRFPADALAPGDRLGSYELFRQDGTRISSGDLLGAKPVLLIMGSISCPMTAASMPAVKRLHSRFGAGIDFVMINVREAHPGENIPQPKQLADKLNHARSLESQFSIPFRVVSDDLAGSLHRGFGALPNAAILLDRDGTVLFRALWAGDEGSLRNALDAVAHGERPPKAQSARKLVPMAQGLGEMRGMLERSGDRAVADVWKAAPQLAVIAWTAGLFRPLPPIARTVAAVGLLIGLPLTLAGFFLMGRSAPGREQAR